nr:sulfatase-like hydrolase/transferase [Crateriforma conspicua]
MMRILLAAFFAVSFAATSIGLAEDRPNVLLILVDDLKPAIGAFGNETAQTPNLDDLTRRGMRFDAAYCNQAVCAPSRFTLMLGSHSTSTGLYGLGNRLRESDPDAVTMPQHFAANGYRTESLGKVFHIGHGNIGDPESFQVPHFKEKVIEYADPASTDGGNLTREEAFFTNQKLGEIKSLPRGAAYESPDVADTAYADGRVAEETIRRLEAAKKRRQTEGTPFFIAAGFARPHLPFSAPKKYWDLYDPAELPMPENEQLPQGAPEVAGKRGGEISNYKPVPEEREASYSDDLKRNLIHGYYAATSFVDAQIGKVVQAVDRLGLDDNTIIVLWGDHGFHLGDLGIWTKHTNFEQANRIPIVIVAPGVAEPGSSTGQLTETVDIYPTLAELAGLPKPTGPQPIDGVSLVPVLKDRDARVRDHAYHAYPKKMMGRAIRTDRYRLVQWKRIGAPDLDAEYELYDYQSDPLETKNLAADMPQVVRRLSAILATYPQAVPRAGTKSAAGKKKNGKGQAKPKAAAVDAQSSTIAGRWSAKRANNWYRQIDWPLGANFVPSTAINQLEMWQEATFDPDTIDRELGYAEKIGMNTMRVFLHDIPWRTDAEGFFRRVDRYLEIADSHGIRTMFVFFDGVWHPNPVAGLQPQPVPGVHNSGWVQSPGRTILDDPAGQDALKPYVQSVLRRYADDSRVLVWDLFNEPDNGNGNSYGLAGQNLELNPDVKRRRAHELLEKTFRWAREVNPSQPLTVGLWTGDYVNKPRPIDRLVLDNNDVHSFHTYGGPQTARRKMEDLLALGRPLLCTEYMARGNNSTFAGVLPILNELKVGAYNWGFVNGRSQTIYPWDSWQAAYTSIPDPWFHDIFHTDGRAYDSAETDLIRRLSESK